ncbi:Keratin, type I cytoskeletal 18 [Oryzias melastigma]|uniref:Keratin, type I cytoskeletal 18 n=2 Tax=Oryzias melastigma TaxID=30732 RepID=A0A834L0J5_ORYME|nr:keratin, type I cytoskeletal 18 isoform X2 [Oryzias melastigma]KAF6737157.1 Keratin, type I cytoskeletal 18 [Oryzias melastigma]
MSRSSSRSLFGVPGSRGARASVSSLEGLRKVLRNEQDREIIPQTRASLQRADVPDSSAPPAADDAENKQTLRGLNDRLVGYLERVKRLREENQDLQNQIDEIEAKRKDPRGRDWKQTLDFLEELNKKIKEITLENAKILLQINNSVLANEDFKKKLEEESKASKELDRDLEDLKKILDSNKLTQEHLQQEMELLKTELAQQTKEHQAEVDSLCEKIKESKVTVEIESQNSNLADVVRNIRGHYEKVAEKNMKEMDNWYCTKFENIQVEEAQNQEALESGKSELKDLLKQKKILEIQIKTLITTIKSLEDTIWKTKDEYNLRLQPICDIIRDLKNQLAEVTLQVEQQSVQNRDLLGIKMKLEQEIQKYDDLMCGITDPQRPEVPGPDQPL